MSHATKVFRTILMSKEYRHVWIESRRNVPGLPDCPRDLSEPQYSHLLFVMRCDVSPRRSTLWVWPLIRVRFVELQLRGLPNIASEYACARPAIPPSSSVSLSSKIGCPNHSWLDLNVEVVFSKTSRQTVATWCLRRSTKRCPECRLVSLLEQFFCFSNLTLSQMHSVVMTLQKTLLGHPTTALSLSKFCVSSPALRTKRHILSDAVVMLATESRSVQYVSTCSMLLMRQSQSGRALYQWEQEQKSNKAKKRSMLHESREQEYVCPCFYVLR
jgi:hypothetical protein